MADIEVLSPPKVKPSMKVKAAKKQESEQDPPNDDINLKVVQSWLAKNNFMAPKRKSTEFEAPKSKKVRFNKQGGKKDKKSKPETFMTRRVLLNHADTLFDQADDAAEK